MADLTAEMIVDGMVPSDPQIAPDGRLIAFVVAPMGRRDARPRSAIWVAPADGSTAPQRITLGIANDRSPRWSPDSAWLYFLSDRAEPGKAQLQRLSMRGGEAAALTAWQPQIADFVPLPDGRTVALLAVDHPTTEQARRERERDDADVFGASWPFARLRLVDVVTREVQTVEHANLRDRHVVALAASLDGRLLAAVSWSTPEIDHLTLPNQLHIIDRSTHEAYTLCTVPCAINRLIWSHDSRQIYYLMYAAGGGIGGSTIFSVDLSTGLSRMLKPEQDGCPIDLCYGCANNLLVTVATGLDTAIDWLDTLSGQISRLSEHRGDLSDLTTSADGHTMAALRSTAMAPLDVWAGPSAGSLARITDLRPELREVCWGEQERLTWSAPDGLMIDGLLILPPTKTRADGPFPLITIAHGGPYWRFTDSFQLTWHPSGQWLATHGYAVLLPNPRGGMGHGAEFAACIAGAVGTGDYIDIMAGIDMLIAEGVADPARLGIGGWSQGGFMAAWAVGQTERFRAGVMGAGVSDWGMMVATSDLQHWEGLLGGFTGWAGIGPHRHTALSPISFVAHVRTPMLILHGELDERVPVSQARFFARGLREYGIDYELVVYPRQPHSLGERSHQIDALCRIRSWFDRWLCLEDHHE
jgi:dipeptidyl aminopeptidase/acylaminoacyl peptidase